MEIQVKRLADGIGSSDTARGELQDVETLIANWCLGGVGGSANRELAERLNKALANLNLA